MKLINIEGIDKCGKSTQATLLSKYYKQHGKRSEILNFPTNTPIGLECKKYKNGKYGSPLQEDPIFSSLLYTVDRYLKIEDPVLYRELYRNNDYVICTRYRISNLIYHLHQFNTDEKKMDYISFINKAESGLPQEDITLILMMPYGMSIDMLRKKGMNKEDIDEAKLSQQTFNDNISWIKKNIDSIEKMWSTNKDYHIKFVDCTDINGYTLSPEAILDNIICEIINL